jgi:hypothetical protein
MIRCYDNPKLRDDNNKFRPYEQFLPVEPRHIDPRFTAAVIMSPNTIIKFK